MDTSQRLKTLIELAKADGELSEKERHYIISIGQANHLMVAEILALFNAQSDTVQSLVADGDKEELLLQLVKLMEIDDKVYKTEIRFCARVASRLGFREEAVFELMLRGRELGSADKGMLKTLMAEFKLV